MTAPRARCKSEDEQGVVLMIVALGVTMLLTIAAIVIDLGRAYVSARQMQNASDSAAMAGAHTLDTLRLDGSSAANLAATVDGTVRRIARRNGAEPSLVTCTFIQWDGTVLGPCSNMTLVGAADGVQVNAGAVNQSTFARIIGVDHLQMNRQAAATVQPLIGQDAPLLVCAFDQSGQPDILLPSGATYTINPASVSPDGGLTGPVYRAHGPQVADCGLQGNSWKGVAGEGPFMLPDWLPISTGVHAGPTRGAIAGEPPCGDSYQVGCVIILPICSGSNGKSGIAGQLFCELFGAFKAVAGGANTHDFRLLGAAEGIVGIGGNGVPGLNDVRLVRLIR